MSDNIIKNPFTPDFYGDGDPIRANSIDYLDPSEDVKDLLYYPYDRAIIDVIRSRIKMFESQVPVVFATPDRYYAEYRNYLRALSPDTVDENIDNSEELYNKQMVDRPHFQDANSKILPLPFIAVQRISQTFVQDRWHKRLWRKIKFTSDRNGVYQSRTPQPYDLGYQIDVWVKKQSHMNAIVSTMLGWFDPDLILAVDHGEPWGIDGNVHAKLDGVNDTSDLEPGEDQNRKLRKTIDITVQAKLFTDAWVTPTVRTISNDFHTFPDVNIKRGPGSLTVKKDSEIYKNTDYDEEPLLNQTDDLFEGKV